MPYLVAIVLILFLGGAAIFSFENNTEKYENSILESQWSTINKSSIKTPQIISVRTTRENIILADPQNNELHLTLLNPEDDKSVRTFPDNSYAPSLEAVKLASSNFQASSNVVKQLRAQSK